VIPSLAAVAATRSMQSGYWPLLAVLIRVAAAAIAMLPLPVLLIRFLGGIRGAWLSVSLSLAVLPYCLITWTVIRMKLHPPPPPRHIPP
jgi:hypothetical protein